MQTNLVIQLARFGDLVQTKRLVLSLLLEGAQVHLCVDTSLASLARLLYPDCEVHAVVAHAFGLDKTKASATILETNRRVFRELQRIKFDRVYSLNFSGLGFSMAALFAADRVTGYAMRGGQQLIATWPAMAMRWSRDRRIGINLVDFWAWYADRPIDGEEVNPPAQPRGGGIGVVLAGRESRRSLPVPVLSRIVSTLYAKSGSRRVVLFGSRSEEGAGRSLLRSLPRNIAQQTENLAGKTDWPGLADAVSSLDQLLTPDTGTMHLAAHLGVPVLACFLSSAWCFETGPYGHGHTVLQSLTDCLPCLESQPCPYEVKCLQPFEQDGMLRYLTTRKPAHCPEGMLVFAPEFDGLGQTYAALAGTDPQKNGRNEFRRFLLAHLGRTDSVFEGPKAHELALRLYQEKDWMTGCGVD